MFRFDKLRHLSKSVHTGENCLILTVSNKKINYLNRYRIVGFFSTGGFASASCGVYFGIIQNRENAGVRIIP
jgi:hypothetical protein